VNFKNFIKKINKKIVNSIYIFYLRRFRKYIRLSSYPQITGDTFRNLSDHILDEVKKIDLNKIRKNDLIFVKTDYLDEFFNIYYSKITIPIKLVTHNSDINLDNINVKNFNFHRDIWYGQNVSFNSDSVKPIPIGIENRSFLKNGKLNHFKNLNLTKTKDSKILCSFNPNTNLERKTLLRNIQQSKNIEVLSFPNHKIYINELSKYKFNICPPGNGLDTHRFWESLTVKALPIVKKSEFLINFYDKGVPMYLIDSWKDLNFLDFDKLNQEYKKFFNTKLDNQEYLDIRYWIKY